MAGRQLVWSDFLIDESDNESDELQSPITYQSPPVDEIHFQSLPQSNFTSASTLNNHYPSPTNFTYYEPSTAATTPESNATSSSHSSKNLAPATNSPSPLMMNSNDPHALEPQAWRSGTGQGPFTVDAGGGPPSGEVDWSAYFAYQALSPQSLPGLSRSQPASSAQLRGFTQPLTSSASSQHLPLRNPSVPDLRPLGMAMAPPISSPHSTIGGNSIGSNTTGRSGRKSRQNSASSSALAQLSQLSMSTTPDAHGKPYGRPPPRTPSSLSFSSSADPTRLAHNAATPWILPGPIDPSPVTESGPPPSAGLSPYLGSTSSLNASLDPSGSLCLADLDPLDALDLDLGHFGPLTATTNSSEHPSPASVSALNDQEAINMHLLELYDQLPPQLKSQTLVAELSSRMDAISLTRHLESLVAANNMANAGIAEEEERGRRPGGQSAYV